MNPHRTKTDRDWPQGHQIKTMISSARTHTAIRIIRSLHFFTFSPRLHDGSRRGRRRMARVQSEVEQRTEERNLHSSLEHGQQSTVEEDVILRGKRSVVHQQQPGIEEQHTAAHFHPAGRYIMTNGGNATAAFTVSGTVAKTDFNP